MPHSPELIERMLKEAGFFDDVKSWFSGFFGPKPPDTKEKKKALSRVNAHFDSKEKDWDKLISNANRKSFAKAIASDPRADDKLKMHVDNMNRLQTGKQVGSVAGGGGKTYRIIKLRGSNRLGCTCNDWRYKKSVAQPGEQVDCKHIRQFKQMNKTALLKKEASYSLRDALMQEAREISDAVQEVRDKPMTKEHWEGYSRHSALNAGQAARALRYFADYPRAESKAESMKRRTAQLVNSLAFTALPPTHHTPESTKGMLKGTHGEWFRHGYAPWEYPDPEQMNKTASETYYHGSRYKSHKLRKGAYVTPYKEDALSFAVPWSTDDLEYAGGPDGRPPSKLKFKKKPPRDHKIHLYKVKAPVKKAKTNTGASYDWNRVTTSASDLELIKTIPSWKKELLVKTAGHVEDRIAQRAPGATYEVAKIKAAIPTMNLRRGQTYHVPLKGGKGYVVIGDVGNRHVIKTVLAPHMRPPGERARV
jgi:hypothetical protein